MLTVIARRAIGGVILLVSATIVAYAMIGARPEGIAQSLLGQQATQEQVDLRIIAMGLDRPLVVRYWEWLSAALTGDLGTSWFSSETVWNSISTRLPVTLSIVGGAVIVSAVVSMLLGVLGASKRGGIDRGIQVATVIGYGLPGFVIALALVTIFAVQLGWFPATSYISPQESLSGWMRSITLPVLALSVATVASVTQQVRSAVGGELRKEYVRTLRSRGVSERRLLFRHVLRAAAVPGLTVLALEFVGLLGGAVVVENVFGLPGIGALAVANVPRGDVPVIMGLVVATVGIVLVVNTGIDLIIAWLNPKSRTT